MKIKDGKFEMPRMEQVTFDMEDVICTSGGVCTGHCRTVCDINCVQVCRNVCSDVTR